jgi:Zn-dependent protease
LPESHGCTGIQKAKDNARRKIADSFAGTYEPDEEFFVETSQEPKRKSRRPSRRKRSRFSRTEKRDLAISSILVILVGISMLSGTVGLLSIIIALNNLVLYILGGLWWVPIITIGLFLATFMIHEMAHKFAAQRFGMWAEFRMTANGYYMSALAILFSIPIFGTGVVFTSGAKSMEEDGKVNLAGPFSNFVVASILLVISLLIFLSLGPLHFLTLFVLQTGIILNSILGLFNMIPFQPFDGGTVRAWNTRVWAIQTVLLLILLLSGYLLLPLL